MKLKITFHSTKRNVPFYFYSLFSIWAITIHKFLRFFVEAICIELSVNFALKFQLKYQVAETLMQCQDFFYRWVVLGGLEEFNPPTPLPSPPTQFFKPKKILKRSIINYGDIILNVMYNTKLQCIPWVVLLALNLVLTL